MAQTSLQLIAVTPAPDLPYHVFCGMYELSAETAADALRALTSLVVHHRAFGLPIGGCHILAEKSLLSFVEEES